MTVSKSPKVMVVGAGPAGLMAAEQLRGAGYEVIVYDAKPSACRKFLVAGIGGLNITHSEPYTQFIQRYYEKADWLHSALKDFDADRLQQWVNELGFDTRIGSSGRVFPADMKAAPLLRAWLKRLRASGVSFNMRHRLQRISRSDTGYALQFEHKGESVTANGEVIILAMGGASWPKLGSDGAWQDYLVDIGVNISPLKSANCGFLSPWSEHLKNQYAGEPLKNIGFRFTPLNGGVITRQGECILSHYGLEGSLIYAYSKVLRDTIEAQGEAQLFIDLLPQFSIEQIRQRLTAKPQGKNSLAKHLKRSLKLSGVYSALLYECLDTATLQSMEHLAASIKALPVNLKQAAPIARAISSAGGVCENSVDASLMLHALPGVFCAGEMLDWEAPTGGYLLNACFATGRLAAQGAIDYLNVPK